MIKFLEERYFMFERVNMNIDVHLSDAEIKEFQKLAKEINPAGDFAVKGCQSCANSLVKFVFNNQNTRIKKMNFPSDKKENGKA